MAETREFEVIVYGATGYTGRLVAEHLLKTYGAAGDLAWAIAGRSEAKLKEVRELIGAPATLPLIVADATDPASLQSMVKRTKVMLTTVGPFQLYGTPLVAACAAAGTDYVDITGESHWVAAMQDAHDAAAAQSGARLVFSCGFDSIPFDLGVYFVQRRASEVFGAPAPRVRGRVRGVRGGPSGGTLASGMATRAAAEADPAIAALRANPFALTPGFEGPAQPEEAVYEDPVTGSWVAPFIMAKTNTKTVHRSNYLMGHPWGRDLRYDELLMIDAPPKDGESPSLGFDVHSTPKPGEGPSREAREAGFYDLLFIAEAADGRTVRTAVKGDRDPGYGSTSRMLGESAVCLARDVPRSVTPGGCWTTASAMAEPLTARLKANAGITFTVEA
ncbi:saccharopine dehydrogenase NADP-binding domain-containing protein [Aquincola sp. S2]|uniref:Saccharopine dehydrogenase NADP-binding domain-containing protein n=1 Tax=Pseudaquabacterium terrae TaxID=2732868 RepID=A0ABX2EBH2_9BURK|nr:saccharopine dehydrogenase NADP-binding domain-containing protein [Aquabacterium terrae]NRF65926.1 saccharopine dehydrogenase NADP-binding domain-containing protein [Aquabacterium terrae]